MPKQVKPFPVAAGRILSQVPGRDRAMIGCGQAGRRRQACLDIEL